MTNEERDNILDQHKTIYDGYVTSYAQQPKEQPLYTQDFANDKQGLTVNNKGVVTSYKNMGINEMKHDGKSTGLFSSEEPKEGSIQPSSVYTPEETFESEFEVVTDFSDDDDNFKVNVGAHRDMIGDGNHDLGHGVFGHEEEEDEILVSPEVEYFDDEDDDLVFTPDSDIFNDVDEDDAEGLFDSLAESLDMFKRFTKYN
jgi:hypothetical protein